MFSFSFFLHKGNLPKLTLPPSKLSRHDKQLVYNPPQSSEQKTIPSYFGEDRPAHIGKKILKGDANWSYYDSPLATRVKQYLIHITLKF